MFLDTIHGIIKRRVLLNYRIQPDILSDVLPSPFRPKLYQGYGIGGICMIQFSKLRPKHIPEFLGIDSENAAHRIAVEWESEGKPFEGVFIPRRDTNSVFNATLGGRVFPGIFQKSIFHTQDSDSHFSTEIIRADGYEEASFSAELCPALNTDSIFPSLAEAASFFSLGATGYSATHHPGHFHGMELKSLDWTISPLKVSHFRSSFFDDGSRFPSGSVNFDCGLIMRDIPHEWHSRPDIHAEQGAAANP